MYSSLQIVAILWRSMQNRLWRTYIDWTVKWVILACNLRNAISYESLYKVNFTYNAI